MTGARQRGGQTEEFLAAGCIVRGGYPGATMGPVSAVQH
jgi:hypothetical protein